MPSPGFVCATNPNFYYVGDCGPSCARSMGTSERSGMLGSGSRRRPTGRSSRRHSASGSRSSAGHRASRSTLAQRSSPCSRRRSTCVTATTPIGVDVNNASIILCIACPERLPSTDYPAPTEVEARRSLPDLRTRTIILGGDAQTDTWGRVRSAHGRAANRLPATSSR